MRRRVGLTRARRDHRRAQRALLVEPLADEGGCFTSEELEDQAREMAQRVVTGDADPLPRSIQLHEIQLVEIESQRAVVDQRLCCASSDGRRTTDTARLPELGDYLRRLG
jgi:hypothetical protein